MHFVNARLGGLRKGARYWASLIHGWFSGYPVMVTPSGSLWQDMSTYLYGYGLYSYGLYSYGLNNYCLHSYGLYGYGLYSYGMYSYALYSYALYMVMASIVMAGYNDLPI